MSSLPFPARKRIGYERSVEKRIENPIDSVMKQAVADACFMDAPWFGIGDTERLVFPMPIGSCREFSVKGKHVIREVSFELLYILAPPLSIKEFAPRIE